MPIRSDLRHFYGLEWKHHTRPMILARAGGQVTGPDLTGRFTYHGGARCEQCGRPDRVTVEVFTTKDETGEWYMLWRPTGGPWYWQDGKEAHAPVDSIFQNRPQWHRKIRTTHTVITVAHLNHRPGDDRPENLKALCQFCHLHYDALHHHETRGRRKDAERPLLA